MLHVSLSCHRLGLRRSSPILEFPSWGLGLLFEALPFLQVSIAMMAGTRAHDEQPRGPELAGILRFKHHAHWFGLCDPITFRSNMNLTLTLLTTAG